MMAVLLAGLIEERDQEAMRGGSIYAEAETYRNCRDD